MRAAGDIVIIGAGECGVRAAFTLREAGFDGGIALIGEEPHLPYERPPLSKNSPVAIRPIAEEARFAEIGITLLRGRQAASIECTASTARMSDGEQLAYDKLRIATGARARHFPGMEAALTLRSVDDAHAILHRLGPGTSLAIIGGGFIGLELAATARKIGAQVTVIEAADRVMARIVPAEIAAVAEERHREEGVEIILGVPVAVVREDAVGLADGRVIKADLVVAGVGAEPETRLAAAAGLAVANGIIVDEKLATSDPKIFAAGDCCSFPHNGSLVRLESWRSAQDQGAHAARSMLGEATPYRRVPWFWSDQYDLTLQVAGMPQPALPQIHRELGDGAFILFQLNDSGRLVSASGIGCGNTIAKDIRLAEMMIEKDLRPAAEELQNPAVKLKTLLRGA